MTTVCISLLALLVSVSGVVYNARKDKRSRRHSIEDDYWLRKVIGPIAIEPLLKALLEMISNSPPDCGSINFSKSNISVYHAKYVETLAELAANVSALRLVDDALAASTSNSIDAIQELMIEYCYENEYERKEDGKATKPRQSFQKAAREELVAMLQHIKSFQMKLD